MGSWVVKIDFVDSVLSYGLWKGRYLKKSIVAFNIAMQYILFFQDHFLRILIA